MRRLLAICAVLGATGNFAFAQSISTSTVTKEKAEQEKLLPPTLSGVRISADGSSVEIKYFVRRFASVVKTRLVPVTRAIEEMGVKRPVSEFVAQMVKTDKAVLESRIRVLSLADVEVRTIKGMRYKNEEIAAALGQDFVPVILVERKTMELDGQSVTKPVKFDQAYLTLFKPDTLILSVPESASEESPDLLAPLPLSRTFAPDGDSVAPSLAPPPSDDENSSSIGSDKIPSLGQSDPTPAAPRPVVPKRF